VTDAGWKQGGTTELQAMLLGEGGTDDGGRFDEVGTSKIGAWPLWMTAMMLMI
jgi:hypothetical protein